MSETQKAAKRTKATDKPSTGFTTEERAAMKERLQEQKAAARKEDGDKAVLEKLAGMPKPDRSMGERLHAIIQSAAPTLTPKLWYGMPAYEKEGKVVCFFQGAEKFKTRYATFGFSDSAKLDDGVMWPVAFALTEITPAVEKRVGALVKKAVS
jgi:hypothetical protein